MHGQQDPVATSQPALLAQSAVGRCKGIKSLAGQGCPAAVQLQTAG